MSFSTFSSTYFYSMLRRSRRVPMERGGCVSLSSKSHTANHLRSVPDETVQSYSEVHHANLLS